MTFTVARRASKDLGRRMADDATPRMAVIWRKKRPNDVWVIGDNGLLSQNAVSNAGRAAVDIAVFRAEPPDGKRKL